MSQEEKDDHKKGRQEYNKERQTRKKEPQPKKERAVKDYKNNKEGKPAPA